MALHGFLNCQTVINNGAIIVSDILRQLLRSPQAESIFRPLLEAHASGRIFVETGRSRWRMHHEEIACNRGPACGYRHDRSDGRAGSGGSARSSQRDRELAPAAHRRRVPERFDRTKEFEHGFGNTISVLTLPKSGSHHAGAEGGAFCLFATALLTGAQPGMPSACGRCGRL
jgi:hypothetical protein